MNLSELIEMIRQKGSSGNDVLVERITLKRPEFIAVLAYLVAFDALIQHLDIRNTTLLDQDLVDEFLKEKTKQ